VLAKMSEKNIEVTYQLSSMQMGMLLHYLIDPGSGVYIQQLIASIHEQIDITAFQKAWEQVVARHSILRTSFRWEGIEEPLQDVHAKVDLPFEHQDWREHSAPDQENKFEEFLKLDRQRGINLTSAPLMRLALFRMENDRYKFIWTSHHILSDGRSRHIVLNDMSEYYDGYRNGRSVRLDPALQFQKHIQWLQEKNFSESETFWRHLLRGFTAPVVIESAPYIKNGTAERSGKGTHRIQISKTVTSGLEEVARQNNLTLNTLVQAAWALLLSHYSGKEDIVFGAVRACRQSTVEGAEDIVGCFINTLPVRVQVSHDQSLLPWLKELREQNIAVRQHEQTPLSLVLGWSEVPRPTPLFESMIVFDNSNLNTRLRSQSERWKRWDIEIIEETDFPLVLYGFGRDKLTLKISYDRSRFDDVTAQNILQHLNNLLGGIAEGSDRPIGKLPILTDSERDMILIEWNNTKVDYNLDLCLHEIFEAQAQKTPDAIAVSFEGTDLTYQELNQRANQLAHHLVKLGVGPEMLVGVCMERSIDLVIALYGILKAGGAYVPIDPQYPSERVAFMLEDTQVPVVLTQKRLQSRLSTHGAKVIYLESDWDTIAEEMITNPDSGVLAENLAYVIYTSGSTGKPKGVMNTHQGIVNRLLWMQDTFSLTENDRILQKTPYSFDVSVWEFFWPLLFGARLIIARPEGHKDSAYLVKTIIDQEITTIHFVPSMLQVFLEDKGIEKCFSLKRVICSGEALSLSLQNLFFARLDTELHNLYGPTEAAVDVSHWACQKDGNLEIVPIGRPIANTQLYILDRSLNPVPIGVLGELHIGGVQVARGYLNRSDLTDEKFMPDPFSDDPKARLYKTGDLVRFLPDGNIAYSGRLDTQVKLRGFRIELGEIETTLGQHQDIREVVVLAHQDVPDDNRLVAYFVPKSQSQLSLDKLRDFLKGKLPEYMLPSAYVQLESMPLTPNGKIDRRNLPMPARISPSKTEFRPPEDDLEKTIARIWQEVLKVEKVGINDNFFDLGGHSLLIARVHNQLRDIVEREFSITDMFRFPTIRALSQHLNQASGDGDPCLMQQSSDRAKARRETMMRRSQRRMG
jgi:amino acid adenylation domain-containing protein